MRRSILLFVLSATVGASLKAQNEGLLEKVNPLGTEPSGFRLQNVSVFMTYYSVAPEQSYTTGIGSLKSDTAVGGAASLGYTKFGERSSTSFVYAASYTERLRYSGNAVNHSLSLNWRRNLTPKWSFTFSVSGSASSISDTLLTSTALAKVVDTPATFEEFTSAIVTGRSTNNQLAAILTNAPIIESPTGLQLYGSRALTASVQSGMTYFKSNRLRFYATGGVNRSQPLNDFGASTGVRSPYIIAQTTGVTANAGIGYSVSPRTQLKVDVTSTRTVSNFQDAYTTTGNVGVARTMGMNWFVQVHGGTGVITSVRQSASLPSGLQYQAGGSIGYKTRTHTFIADVERMPTDSYGYGAAASLAATGAWSWKRPSNPWRISANFAQQWLNGSRTLNINSWRATGEVGRMLGRNMTLSAQYAYLSDLRFVASGAYGGQHILRVSLNWVPGAKGIMP
jgi:hypothetical protein